MIVVAAGIAAQRDGRRHSDRTDVSPSSENAPIIPISRPITQGCPDIPDQRKDTIVYPEPTPFKTRQGADVLRFERFPSHAASGRRIR